ncbi:MAG: zf-HC2 domain-containing protein, partial [Chloroflexi bacterium]|nr:zf-HC2 domain-containing protein [Chloroflexota bacterium]
MKCEPALISAYLDGALSPSRRRQIESHMRICPVCRAMHRDYLTLRRGMDSLPWQQAPDRLQGGIRAQIAAHQMRGTRRPRRWVPLSSAAAVAVVALSAASAPAWLFSGSPATAARPVVTFSLPLTQPAAIPSDSVIELRFGASVDREAVQQVLAVSPPV